MNNPNPEKFRQNIDTIREHARILPFRDRKYFWSIESQLEKKPIEDFSESQYNIINEIARRVVRKAKRGHIKSSQHKPGDKL